MEEIKKLENSNGITIRQLKNCLNSLPDSVIEGTVWIETEDGKSNQCKSIWPLNMRIDDETSDIILSAEQWKVANNQVVEQT